MKLFAKNKVNGIMKEVQEFTLKRRSVVKFHDNHALSSPTQKERRMNLALKEAV